MKKPFLAAALSLALVGWFQAGSSASAQSSSPFRFLYLTVPEGDANAGMWAQAHLKVEPEGKIVFAYRPVGTEAWQEVPAEVQPVQFAREERWLCRGFLPVPEHREIELEVRMGRVAGGRMRFRSLPEDGQPVRFIDGGDNGLDEIVGVMMGHAAATRPDFALVGGDLAYEDGEPARWGDMDEWLQRWCERMVTPEGLTVPLVAVVGNHEVHGGGGFKQTIAEATFWNPYFNLSGKRAYCLRQFGGYFGLWSLDSGHCAPFTGEQAQWLDQTLTENAGLSVKMAAYHTPLYPSSRNFNDDHTRSLRETWGPIFDKHHLTVALEHHDHTFKRTHPLRAGQIDPAGTVYLGDGCWGQESRSVDTRRPFLAKAESRRHIWKIEVAPERWSAVALDTTGEPFDQAP